MQFWTTPTDEEVKKKEQRKIYYGRSSAFWYGTFMMLFSCSTSDVVKTLEDVLKRFLYCCILRVCAIFIEPTDYDKLLDS